MNENNQNPELRDLGTHMAGAVDLHETRKTAKPASIKSAPAPGPMLDEEESKS